MTTNPPTIVGLGEVLWDVFPDGRRFGGAPANFACHAAALGAQANLVSAVGMDELGDSAIAALERHQVATGCVSRIPQYPTGAVQVEIDPGGHPRYEFGRDEAWDHLPWSDALAELVEQTDAVCFGTLGQRSRTSRDTIQRFLGAVPEDTLRVLDINLRLPYVDEVVIEQSLGLANVLKLNDDELEVLASAYKLSGSAADRMRQLAERFDLRLVALSRGEQGAVLMQDAEVAELPGIEVDVKDTVGAGDAFTAAMTLDYLAGHSLSETGRHACRVAAFVCSQPGATPRLPDELLGTRRGRDEG